MTRNRRFASIAAIGAAMALAGCTASATTTTSGSVGPGDPVAGATVYATTCRACHATDLSGINGLGRALLPNDFVSDTSEEDLAAFLAVGRSKDDPDNDKGIDMPPRGGNPSLSDQALRDVAAYLKAQQ